MKECKTCCGLNPVSFGFGFAVVGAIFTFVYGLFAWLFHWGIAMVTTMSSVYVGFGPTLLGSILGAIWAFVMGFITGYLIALFYNLCLKCSYCRGSKKEE